MNGNKLKKLIEDNEILVAPGCFDALSSLIAYKAGFKIAVMGGYSNSATQLGKPDLGILTMNEMADTIRRLTDVSPLPLIADGDTGYGGEWNVKRCVKEYERAGAAAIILEDQVFPKRCGHYIGKQVISKEEHGKKIQIAKDTASDMLVFARTDALSVLGINEAVQRGQYYLRAGADAIFIEAPKSEEELIIIGRNFKNETLIANMIEGGKTPIVSQEQLKKMGYNIVFYALTGLFTYAKALTECYNKLKEENTSVSLKEDMFDFNSFNELLETSKYLNR